MNTQDLNALLHSLQAWHLEGRRESIDGILPPVETAPVVVRQDTLHQVLLSAGLPVVETVKRLQDLGWVRVVEGKPAPSWRAAGTFASSAAGRIGAMTDRPSPAQQPLRWYAIEPVVLEASCGDDNLRAETPQLFCGPHEPDADLRDLVILLDRNKGGEKSRNQIAREFTGELQGEDKKAQTLLRRVRDWCDKKWLKL